MAACSKIWDIPPAMFETLKVQLHVMHELYIMMFETLKVQLHVMHELYIIQVHTRTVN